MRKASWFRDIQPRLTTCSNAKPVTITTRVRGMKIVVQVSQYLHGDPIKRIAPFFFRANILTL